MSHTVLKSSPQRSSTNSLLNEMSGKIEVLWEQLVHRTKREGTPPGTTLLKQSSQDAPAKKHTLKYANSVFK